TFRSTYAAFTLIFSLSLHDALPIYIYFLNSSVFFFLHCYTSCMENREDLFSKKHRDSGRSASFIRISMLLNIQVFHEFGVFFNRSEEHTSELQSRENLVCRLLLEKK